MKAGDTFTDSAGASWVVDGLLGRGLWGRTWALRGDGGAVAVLKVPLAAADFPSDPSPAELAEAAAAASRELARRYRREGEDSGPADPATAAWPFLPRLLATHALEDGRLALILPRFGADLDARLRGGMRLSEAIDVVGRVLNALAHGVDGGAVHGNLRPTNIFLDDDGRPVLADPLVKPLRAVRQRLAAAAQGRVDYHPVEAGRPGAPAAPTPGWDTWALCGILHRAAVAPESAETGAAAGARRALAVPHTGLTKAEVAALKDAATARLKGEHANKRFAGRATEELARVLRRGLSLELVPSPPYRFDAADDLLQRLVDIEELIRPEIKALGAVQLGGAARDGVFEGPEEVVLRVSVDATKGIDAAQDLIVGVQLRDIDAPGDGRVRVPGTRFTVDRYPSGRWRFEFLLQGVPPARYEVRLAFAVKGSEEAPKLAEGRFQVRPRTGYVPPPSAPTPGAALPFPGARPSPAAPRRPADEDARATHDPPLSDRDPAPRAHASPHARHERGEADRAADRPADPAAGTPGGHAARGPRRLADDLATVRDEGLPEEAHRDARAPAAPDVLRAIDEAPPVASVAFDPEDDYAEVTGELHVLPLDAWDAAAPSDAGLDAPTPPPRPHGASLPGLDDDFDAPSASGARAAPVAPGPVARGPAASGQSASGLSASGLSAAAFADDPRAARPRDPKPPAAQGFADAPASPNDPTVLGDVPRRAPAPADAATSPHPGAADGPPDLDDPVAGLYDYPFPGRQGAELPDAGDDPLPARGALDAVRDRLLEAWRRDPVTTAALAALAAFILFAVLRTLLT